MALAAKFARNAIAARLGVSGLANVARINMAASHATIHFTAMNKLLEEKMWLKKNLEIKYTCEVAEKDCISITAAYEAFKGSAPGGIPIRHLSEMLQCHESVFKAAESINSLLAENSNIGFRDELWQRGHKAFWALFRESITRDSLKLALDRMESSGRVG